MRRIPSPVSMNHKEVMKIKLVSCMEEMTFFSSHIDDEVWANVLYGGNDILQELTVTLPAFSQYTGNDNFLEKLC
ncbi:hypothetical protein BRADI_5g07352v3 [Brachypodium distachyon]|uniref:Uncharacterized protein n=1 Tax=Brachypodium distachyon TaxID=15368 RepID=A0A2K2CFR9_BRADI|nr:hypothetical protein BRADI_5g07352v3 [Brachypodium distachyon]